MAATLEGAALLSWNTVSLNGGRYPNSWMVYRCLYSKILLKWIRGDGYPYFKKPSKWGILLCHLRSCQVGRCFQRGSWRCDFCLDVLMWLLYTCFKSVEVVKSPNSCLCTLRKGKSNSVVIEVMKNPCSWLLFSITSFPKTGLWSGYPQMIHRYNNSNVGKTW